MSSKGNTDEFLSKILPKEKKGGAGAASSSSSSFLHALAEPKEGAINLEIWGRISVSRSDFQIITPNAEGQHHPFNVEYRLPIAVSAEELRALPIIVDVDPDTFKMGDRCGVQNLRINGMAFPTEMWEVCHWRPEVLLSANGKWMAENQEDHERIRDMYKAEISGQKKMVLKSKVLGDGRGLKLVMAEGDGTTNEQYLFGNESVTLNTMNHAFRSSLKRAAEHAFSLVLLDPSIKNIESLTYDLVTSSLGMTVGVENGPHNSPTSQTAWFSLALHSLKPSLLAPSCIQHLHKCRPINIKAVGTVGYGQTPRVNYAAMRGESFAVPTVSEERKASVGSSAVLNKHTGFRVTGELKGAYTHAVTPMQAQPVPYMELGVLVPPVVVYVVTDPDNAPTAPSLLMWRVEAMNLEKDFLQVISMLPSNLRIRTTLYKEDHVEADLDTDIVHLKEDTKSVMMAAVIDEDTLMKANVPRLHFSPSVAKGDKRTLEIEVNGGDNFEVFIMFASRRFTSISVPNRKNVKVNVHDRDRLFMGSHGAKFEDTTISEGLTAFSAANEPVRFQVEVMLSVRR